MKVATIQKSWIDNTLFRFTKVANLVYYLRLEFNIDFISQGVSFCMLKVGNFETILSVNVTKEKQF